MILCVGPTGSRKDNHTSLGSAVPHRPAPKDLDHRGSGRNHTARDSPSTGERKDRLWTLPPPLRAFLRADPDVIMVGEIRDRETAEVSLRAALTGHLVLSTLHTNSAVETVTRFIEMGLDPFHFADALCGVLAQRLVRTLCATCKRTVFSDQRRIRTP
jgi:Tfp pilus assembly ATPase PilU